MTRYTQVSLAVLCGSALCLLTSLLSGCATSFAPSATPSQAGVGEMQGKVHGGQQPVSNAHVYVMQAGTTGYGAAATSLITTGYSGSDDVGNYILSDAAGDFTLTGSYSCTAGAKVYLLAEQGNPGLAAGTNNTAIGLMAALGTCPAQGTLAGTVPYVTINEVSTIVAAYALSGFSTDSTHISRSSTALATRGLANAFAAVPNVLDVADGTALTTTATANSFGTVPQAAINTLANILAACVNTDGVNPSTCSTLFANATANGMPGGTQPTETATAAINMAHHPGQDPSDLWALQTSTAPFQPNLSSAPNDFTVQISYPGGGLSGTSQVAVDGFGDVWAIGNNTLSELSPLGVQITGASGITGSGLNYPSGIAIDAAENVWVANYHGASLSEFAQSGTPLSGAGGFTGNGDLTPYSVAIDLNGNVWTTNRDNGTISKLNSSGSEILNSNDTGYFQEPVGIAIDASNNVWTSDPGSGFVRVHSNSTGVELGGHDYDGCGSYGCSSIALTSGSSPTAWTADGNNVISRETPNSSGGSRSDYSDGGLYQSANVALDGAGAVWVSNANNSVSEFIDGQAVTPSTGYTGSITSSFGIAIDGSGNVWVSDNSGADQVVEFLGAATPVVTPLVQAAMNNNIAGRP